METMLTHEGQISTIRLDSPIAQLVEQRTVNPCVPGSSPGWGAILNGQIHTDLAFLWVNLTALTRSLPWLTHPLFLYFSFECVFHISNVLSSPGWGAILNGQIHTDLAFLWVNLTALTRSLPWLTHPLFLYFSFECVFHISNVLSSPGCGAILNGQIHADLAFLWAI